MNELGCFKCQVLNSRSSIHMSLRNGPRRWFSEVFIYSRGLINLTILSGLFCDEVGALEF